MAKRKTSKKDFRETHTPHGRVANPRTRWVFDSVTEFGAAVEACGPRIPGASNSSETNDDDWCGGLSLPAATAMARDGSPWDEGIRAMRPVALDVEIAGSIERRSPVITNAVQGFAPNVPAFLSGIPDCMMQMEDPPAPERAIRVAVAFIHSAATSADAIKRRGAAMLSVIDALETAGKTIEIWGVYRSQESGVTGSIEVCVKHAGGFWDPGAVSYMLAHPASGRRCGFRFLESQPGCAPIASHGYGFGQGISYADFDCHFEFMSGDKGYEDMDQAVETVAAKFRAVIEARAKEAA